jgi:hypothetical protein
MRPARERIGAMPYIQQSEFGDEKKDRPSGPFLWSAFFG